MSKRLRVVVDDEECEQLKEVARRSGLSLSEWVRRSLLPTFRPRRTPSGGLAVTLVALAFAPSASLSAQAAPSSAAAPIPEVRAGDVLVLGGRLFDATRTAAATRPNPGILIRNGTLLHVGLDTTALDVGAAGGVLRLDPGETVLPGFFDLHAHYAVDLFGEGRVDEYEVNPVVFLANGVTTTFPAGEVDPEGMRRARLEIDRGERPGPRILNSGPYFGSARPGWRHDALTADSIRAEVDFWAARGAEGFKAKGARPDHLRALIEAAHAHGLTVTAHMGSGSRGSVNPRDAILMGIDRVEHFLGGDALPAERSAYASLEALDLTDPATRRAIDDVAELYISHDTHFDATLTAYGYFGARDLDPPVFDPWTDETAYLTPYAREVTQARLAERRIYGQFERIYRVKQATLRAFRAAGGAHLLTVGTDHPSWGEYLSGFSVHRELHGLVRAGFTPAEALRAATLNAATAMGRSDRFGTVEQGKYADLVVVGADPLQDITATRDVRWVIKAGEVHDPPALLRSVEGELGPAGPEDADWWKGNVRLGGPVP